jgi:diguanylate cyclase (GGDEF)-like protein
VLVALLAVVAVLTGRWQLRTAEHRLLGERGKVVTAIAGYRSSTDDPTVLQTMVTSAGFSPAAPAANEALLTAFALTPTQDPALAVGLLDPAGKVLAARPPGARLDAPQLGPAWAAAVRGQPGWSPVFRFGGRPLRAELAAVRASPAQPPWAVLVQVGEDVAGAEFKQALGALGPGAGRGGMSEVDRQGVALLSWDPARTGTRIVDPARLPGPGTLLTAAERLRGVTWTGTGADGTQQAFIAAPELTTGYTILFGVPTRYLYSGPVGQQRGRDETLVAVLAASALGLVAFGAAREMAVGRSRNRLRDLLANTHDLIALVRRDGAVGFVTSSRLLGLPERHWVGRPLTDLVHGDDRGKVSELLDRAVRDEHGEAAATEVRLRGPGPGGGADTAGGPAGFRLFDLTAADTRGELGLDGVLVTCHEAGRRAALLDQLRRRWRHDPLTGLPARATFLARLAGTLATSTADGTRDAVVFVDLDGVQAVSDRLGHAAGDEVLRISARRIAATLRRGDLACRFGGDGFGVLLRDVDPAGAQASAERLVAALGAPISLPGAVPAGPPRPDRVRVGVRAGVAVSAPAAGAVPDLPALLRAAEHALDTATRDPAGPRAVLAPEPAPTLPAWDAASTRRAGADGGPAQRRAGAVEGAARLAYPAPGWPRRSRRRLRAQLAPVLAVGLVLLAVVGIGLWGGAQSRSAQRADTLANERAVAAALASSASVLNDPRPRSALLSALPWSFTAADRAVLDRLAGSAIVGPNAFLVLTDPAGRVLATRPAGAPLPVDRAGATWRAAAAGRGGWAPVAQVAGSARVYELEPITRSGRVAAVLAMGRSSATGIPSQLLGSLARLGSVELVDRAGRAGFVSGPANAGRCVVAAAALAGLGPGEVRDARSSDPGYRAFATPVPSISGYFLVLRRRPADMFNDVGGSLPQVGLLLGIVALTLGSVALADGRRQRALRRDADRFDLLLRGAHDLVTAVGPDGRITVVGPSVTRLLGLRVADWAGRDIGDVAHPEDAARLRAFVGTAARGLGGRAAARATAPPGGAAPSPAPPSPAAGPDGAPAPERAAAPDRLADVRLRTAGGRYRWFDLTASAPAPRSAIRGLLLTCHEIGERRALQDELAATAHQDPLTGLPNRAAFERGLDEAAGRAGPPGQREAGPAAGGWAQTRGWARASASPTPGGRQRAPVGVLLVGVGGIRPAGGPGGRDVGDQVLEITALRLDAAAGAGDLVARYGGDEFAVLVEEADGPRLAEVGERILASLRAPVAAGAAVVTVEAAIGAAVAGPDPDPAGTVRAACAAMRAAKERGGGMVLVADGAGPAP